MSTNGNHISSGQFAAVVAAFNVSVAAALWQLLKTMSVNPGTVGTFFMCLMLVSMVVTAGSVIALHRVDGSSFRSFPPRSLTACLVSIAMIVASWGLMMLFV
jgi:hypothetical protein